MITVPAPLANQQLEIAYYFELQRRVFDIFRYVSCHKANFNVYSVVVESVLVDAGSFFDSQCQTLIWECQLSCGVLNQAHQTLRDPDVWLRNRAQFSADSP
jgi:hypothetical protein